MKKLLFLVVLAAAFSSCNEIVNEVKKRKTETITVDDYRYVIDSKNRRGYVGSDNQPMTGHFIVVRDSIPLEEFYLEDGYLDGEHITYDLKGNLISRENYVTSVKHGPQYTYHKSGEVASEVSFNNGSRNSDEVHYDENKEVVYRKTDVNGVEYNNYYEEGKIVAATFDKIYDGSVFEMIVRYDHFENIEIIFGKKKDSDDPSFNVYDPEFNLVETVNPQEDPMRMLEYAQYFR